MSRRLRARSPGSRDATCRLHCSAPSELRQDPDTLPWLRQLMEQIVKICRHLAWRHPRWDGEASWPAPSEFETVCCPVAFLANHLKLKPVVDIEPHCLLGPLNRGSRAARSGLAAATRNCLAQTSIPAS